MLWEPVVAAADSRGRKARLPGFEFPMADDDAIEAAGISLTPA
jgi:hypothetical protein